MTTTLGVTAKIVLFGKKGKKEVVARVDTGARTSSLDSALAKELEIGPELKYMRVKSAHGIKYRPVVTTDLLIAGELKHAEFTIADRAHMKYRVLIGRNILKKGYLIDPSQG